jgi:ribosomal-protein-alanine N-acetyltransferase
MVLNLTARDIPDVLDISVECGLCLWSAEAYRSEIVRHDSIMLKLANDDGAVAGFAVGRIFHFTPSQFTVELTNIGLRKPIRGQGFGSILLKSFINRCIEAGARSIILEVRVSNATAIGFYEKFGFRARGRRRGFYSNPSEDALTMTLDLEQPRAAKIQT